MLYDANIRKDGEKGRTWLGERDKQKALLSSRTTGLDKFKFSMC
jgi:hypothetical protein